MNEEHPCPNCGRHTDGDLSKGGVRYLLCYECLKSVTPPPNQPRTTMTDETNWWWLDKIERKLSKIGHSMKEVGFRHCDQPWLAWKRKGWTTSTAFVLACADQNIDPLTGTYSAKEDAAREAESDCDDE